MKEHITNKLRQWALMGEVLVNSHYSHDRRWQRVEVIKRLIILEAREEKNSAPMPLWADTLLAILDASRENTGTYSTIDRTEARNTLRLFVDTCNHIISKYHDMWFGWTKEAYDKDSGDMLPSPRNTPFASPKDIKTDSNDDDPFAQAMDDIPFD